MNTKKIAILTYTFSNNFGAVLQAFALGELIKGYGFNVTYLNYKPTSQTPINSSLSIKFKKFILNILEILFFKNVKKSQAKQVTFFDKFRNQYMVATSKKCYNFYDVKNDAESHSFDAYVVGSDWVWRYPYDKVFFLSFLKNKSVMKIAYAASADTSVINEKNIPEFLSLLDNYDVISTREDTLTNNVNAISRKRSQTLADPTLLFNAVFWNKYAGVEPIVKNDYILIYAMKPSVSIALLARRIKRKLGMKSIGIVCGTSATSLLGVNCDEIKLNIGPSEFLNLIKNAKFVLTSSFHGTVFASIFHVPFFSFLFNPNDMRMRDMLTDVGLGDRYLSSKDVFRNLDLTDLDFTGVDSKLAEYRINADKFFSSAFERLQH